VIDGRRILSRGDLFPGQHVRPAGEGERTCHATVKLDGFGYQCARGVIDGFHEGIHDALRTHHDGGAVRW
jgi:hypothetical protein